MIGFNLEAFTAGQIPASNPTPEQIIIPAITHAQGTVKPALRKKANMLPIIIPRIIPNNAPSKLIITDSNKN